MGRAEVSIGGGDILNENDLIGEIEYGIILLDFETEEVD